MSSLRIGIYEVDAELRCSLSMPVDVTAHPVEDGADMTDHARPLPISLSIEGVVSNAPLGDLRARREQFIEVQGETFARPADEADAYFQALRAAREPVTVECSRGIFERMVLADYSPISSTFDELRFSVEFVQVEIATNDRVTLRVEARPKQRKLGHRPSPAVDEPGGPPPPSPHDPIAQSLDSIPAALRP